MDARIFKGHGFSARGAVKHDAIAQDYGAEEIARDILVAGCDVPCISQEHNTGSRVFAACSVGPDLCGVHYADGSSLPEAYFLAGVVHSSR